MHTRFTFRQINPCFKAQQTRLKSWLEYVLESVLSSLSCLLNDITERPSIGCFETENQQAAPQPIGFWFQLERFGIWFWPKVRRSLSYLKGQLISKANCPAVILPKNKRMNLFLLVCDVFLFGFWKYYLTFSFWKTLTDFSFTAASWSTLIVKKAFTASLF